MGIKVTIQDVKPPEHEAIYHRIRDMILFGEVEPGQPVTILGLKEATKAGMTPVREAIRRLTAEGALEAMGNRRVCVPMMTQSKLEQIRFIRMSVEPRLAFLASKNQQNNLIGDLKAIDVKIDAAIDSGNVQSYLEYNYKFHFKLYEAASAAILCKVARSLWLQIGPSLRIVCGKFGTSNLPDRHDEAIEALASGNMQAVAKAVERDICQGMDHVGNTLMDN